MVKRRTLGCVALASAALVAGGGTSVAQLAAPDAPDLGFGPGADLPAPGGPQPVIPPPPEPRGLPPLPATPPKQPIPVQTPRMQAAPARVLKFCEVPPRGMLAVERTVLGRSPGGGREVTELLEGRGYRVSRCDRDGDLVRAQVVGPIKVPGGTALVPIVGVRRRADGLLAWNAGQFGDPKDPRWAAVWRKVRKDVTASVLPPTPDKRRIR